MCLRLFVMYSCID